MQGLNGVSHWSVWPTFIGAESWGLLVSAFLFFLYYLSVPVETPCPFCPLFVPLICGSCLSAPSLGGFRLHSRLLKWVFAKKFNFTLKKMIYQKNTKIWEISFLTWTQREIPVKNWVVATSCWVHQLFFFINFNHSNSLIESDWPKKMWGPLEISFTWVGEKKNWWTQCEVTTT